MPSELLVHQLLHGYRKGHTLLAASTELPAKNSELIKRLSDLSGLSIEDEFNPYFTAYPIPDSNFYAIGKTWPDLQAARRGCVLTHTLLIPNQLLAKAKFLRSLNNSFSKPLNDLSSYKIPIDINELTDFQISKHLSSKKNGEDFVYKYFYQGINPIVWWDESLNNDIFWSILETSWSELKLNFACCTYSLQPRSIDNRLFDLMFAPSEVYARFSKIPRSNFVNRRPSSDFEKEDETTKYWVRQLANVFIYQDSENSLANSIQDFSDLLSADPTSVKNVIKVEQLKKRVAKSPTAAIGLMDLWSTLAPLKQDALQQLRKIISIAIEIAISEDMEDSVKFLYLISERLENPYFENIKQDFSKRIVESVSFLAQENPCLAISISERLFANYEQKNKSSYYEGLVNGLSALAVDCSPLLNDLGEFPVAAAVLITEEPRIAKGYLKASDSIHKESAVRNLSAWIETINDSNKLNELRELLIPDLNDGSVFLADQMFNSIGRDDLSRTLDSISKISRLDEQENLRQIISDRITRIYPSETRTWAGQVQNWNLQCSVILADSFEHNAQNLEDLLSLPGINSVQKGEVLTAYLLSLGSNGFPDWLCDFSSYRADFLIPLMTSDLVTDRTSYLLGLIFTRIHEIPIASEPIILERLESFLSFDWSSQLVHSAMVSLIKGFINGSISWDVYQKYSMSNWASDWLLASPTDTVEFLFREDIDSYNSWKRCWEFLAALPFPFYSSFSHVFPEWIATLISKRRYDWRWTEEEADSWTQIIKNISNAHRDEAIHLQLSSSALNYALRNYEFPLSELVVETFWTVYKLFLETDHDEFFSGTLYNIFGWLNWDWDKAKSLRKKIIQSFIISAWPPGDIVMAIPDRKTLRKIIRRIQDQRNGELYINAILNDLKHRSDVESQNKYHSLNKLLKSEELFEPWY